MSETSLLSGLFLPGGILTPAPFSSLEDKMLALPEGGEGADSFDSLLFGDSVFSAKTNVFLSSTPSQALVLPWLPDQSSDLEGDQLLGDIESEPLSLPRNLFSEPSDQGSPSWTLSQKEDSSPVVNWGALYQQMLASVPTVHSEVNVTGPAPKGANSALDLAFPDPVSSQALWGRPPEGEGLISPLALSRGFYPSPPDLRTDVSEVVTTVTAESPVYVFEPIPADRSLDLPPAPSSSSEMIPGVELPVPALSSASSTLLSASALSSASSSAFLEESALPPASIWGDLKNTEKSTSQVSTEPMSSQRPSFSFLPSDRFSPFQPSRETLNSVSSAQDSLESLGQVVREHRERSSLPTRLEPELTLRNVPYETLMREAPSSKEDVVLSESAEGVQSSSSGLPKDLLKKKENKQPLEMKSEERLHTSDRVSSVQDGADAALWEERPQKRKYEFERVSPLSTLRSQQIPLENSVWASQENPVSLIQESGSAASPFSFEASSHSAALFGETRLAQDILSQATLLVSRGGGRASLTLPLHLLKTSESQGLQGIDALNSHSSQQLHLAIETQGSAVTLKVQDDSPEIRSVFEDNVSSLKGALQNQNLHLAELSFFATLPSGQGQDSGFENRSGTQMPWGGNSPQQPASQTHELPAPLSLSGGWLSGNAGFSQGRKDPRPHEKTMSEEGDVLSRITGFSQRAQRHAALSNPVYSFRDFQAWQGKGKNGGVSGNRISVAV